jgi:hypothetical protein
MNIIRVSNSVMRKAKRMDDEHYLDFIAVYKERYGVKAFNELVGELDSSMVDNIRLEERKKTLEEVAKIGKGIKDLDYDDTIPTNRAYKRAIDDFTDEILNIIKLLKSK